MEALPPGDAPWKPPAIAVYELGDYMPDPRRRDNSPAEATRSTLRSAQSISWTLRLPEA